MCRFIIRRWILFAMSLAWLTGAGVADDKPGEKAADKPSDKPAEPKETSKEAPKEAKAKNGEAKAKKEDAAKEKEKEPAKAVPAAELLKVLKGVEANASKAVENAARAVDEAKESVKDAPAAAPAAKTQPAAKAAPKDGEAVEVKLDETSPKPGEEKKDGTKKDAKAAKVPDPPMFRLRDGTRLAGTPELKQLSVRTAYGKLVVPVAEVLRMRFAAAEDTGLLARVAELVKGLSSEEFDKREEAMAALRDVGAPALPALKKASESEDEEVKSRADKLVGEIEETVDEADGEESALGSVNGDEDEIVTLKFTVRGRVEEDKFALTTRYGALTLSRNDIVSVLFREGPNTKASFTVPGATFAAQNKWVDTKLNITQGQRIHITASGQINVESQGQTTGPEGTTNIPGNQFETHPAGALVAKVGAGKAFLVGADYEGSANATGTLQLSIALNNAGNVSGQYQVEVEKDGDN